MALLSSATYKWCKFKLYCQVFEKTGKCVNPSRPAPDEEKKLNWISVFTLLCGTSKRFMNYVWLGSECPSLIRSCFFCLSKDPTRSAEAKIQRTLRKLKNIFSQNECQRLNPRNCINLVIMPMSINHLLDL